jgi:hypothetical protein
MRCARHTASPETRRADHSNQKYSKGRWPEASLIESLIVLNQRLMLLLMRVLLMLPLRFAFGAND